MAANTYFETSLRDHILYPTNLVFRGSHRKVLEAYKNRLDSASPNLFKKEATTDQLDVRFRDYNPSSKVFDETPENSLDTLTKLRIYLGYISVSNTSRFTKTDPQCRYVLIHSNKNRLALKISRSMANLLLTFHQVMPSYLDFISAFGLQLDQREVRYSGFHEQTTLAVPLAKRPAVPQLNRSGYGYQLCYNLKAVVDKKKTGMDDDRWSVRQAAIHHQFDVEQGTALWICTEGRKVGGLFDRILDLTSDVTKKEDWSYGTKEESFRSSLATHLTCCHWSIEEWRVYMGWLEETVDKVTRAAVSGDRKHVQGVIRKDFEPKDLQDVQRLEDKINELTVILEANHDIMQSLSGFYVNLMKNDDMDVNVKTQCADDVREFAAQIADMMYDVNMQIRRANLLVKITADRKALILQHLQSQATEATLELTKLSYREATIMRIITIVTLIFLPATFASTLFSTDIVKYQGQDANGTFSKEAMFRWLQVTLPLSALTLGIGYAWYRHQTKKADEKGVLPSFNRGA